MSGRRMELSATQVIASMLAAVTGAVAASYAGIGGTIIGVAVMSVASTAGSVVYKHYLGRSRERLRSAAVVIAPVIAPRAHINGSAGHRGRGAGTHAQAPDGQARTAGDQARTAGDQDRAAGDQDRAGRQARVPGTPGSAPDPARAAGQLSGWPWSPDSPVTEGFPTISGEAARWSDPPAGTAGLTGSRAAGNEDATQQLGGGPGNGADHTGPSADHTGPSADHTGPGADSGHDDAGSGMDGDGPGTGAGRARAGTAGLRGARRRWPAMVGAAVGVFVFTLGGITAFEVAAGQPLDALIWGRSSGGTTIGDVTGAQHARPASRPTSPHATPTPSHRATGSPTPTPSSPTPTPTPSSTRSPSPSPSPSPTLSSSASASASPSGSAGRSKAAANRHAAP
jgi:hypothetical protein